MALVLLFDVVSLVLCFMVLCFKREIEINLLL